MLAFSWPIVSRGVSTPRNQNHPFLSAHKLATLCKKTLKKLQNQGCITFGRQKYPFPWLNCIENVDKWENLINIQRKSNKGKIFINVHQCVLIIKNRPLPFYSIFSPFPPLSLFGREYPSERGSPLWSLEREMKLQSLKIQGYLLSILTEYHIQHRCVKIEFLSDANVGFITVLHTL